MTIPDRWLPVLYAVIRLAGAWLTPLPGAVPLDPLPILLALRMRDRPDHDVFSLWFLPGLILGDGLVGMNAWVALPRVLLLYAFCQWPEPGGFHHRAARWNFSYWLLTGLLVDLQGWYPAGLVTLLGLVQGGLWWGLFAPRSGGGELLPAAPLVLPPLALLLIHLILPSPRLWPVPAFGDATSSLWVWGFSLLVFLEPQAWRIGREWTAWRSRRSRPRHPQGPVLMEP